MEETVLKAINELSVALKEDPRVKELNSIEEKLYDDQTLIELVKKKNDLERDYESSLSYLSPDSEEAYLKQKALYEAKFELDSYPLVKKYNEAYIKVRDLYMNIDDIIFGPYRSKTLSSEAK